MSQFKQIVSVFVGVSLSSACFAHVLMKGEVESIANKTYDWTGFYVGLNAGAVNHTMNITDTDASSFNATIQQVSNPKFTGGVQIGYRRQLDLTQASGVYGAEFSANFSNASFSKTYGSPFALYELSSNNTLKNVCLLQLIGGIAANRTLLFLAAGFSWSNITGSTTNIDGAPFFNSFSTARKALGTALGGGIEYAFNDTISARVKLDVITPSAYSTQDDAGNSYQIANSIVQGTLGVNYKFA